jgi:uncharacterized protein
LVLSAPLRLPVVMKLGITTAIAVPLMTWVVMPRMTRLLRAWLYPQDQTGPAVQETKT